MLSTNTQNTHIHHTLLGLTRDLLENRDQKAIQSRLEELKGIMAPLSPVRRARYGRLLQEAAKLAALEELEDRAVSPVSQAAFQALEELEAKAAQLPLSFLEGEQWEDPDGEELVNIAAQIDSADTPETIREATEILLSAINAQEGLYEQRLYCACGQRLMEKKILLEELVYYSSPALSLWNSLHCAPSEALALLLLWHDEEGLFHSTAPEVLASLNTQEELRKSIAFYENALRLSPPWERIPCQRELCRCILRRADLWLATEGLDKDPLFRSFARTIRQYLWGELYLLKDQEDTYRDNLIPPLLQRLSGALEEREIPVPPVLSRLLTLCIAIAMDYSGPFPSWALEGDEPM